MTITLNFLKRTERRRRGVWKASSVDKDGLLICAAGRTSGEAIGCLITMYASRLGVEIEQEDSYQ